MTTTTATDTPLRRWLTRHRACGGALAWLGDRTPERAWAEAPPEYLVWLVAYTDAFADADRVQSLRLRLVALPAPEPTEADAPARARKGAARG